MGGADINPVFGASPGLVVVDSIADHCGSNVAVECVSETTEEALAFNLSADDDVHRGAFIIAATTAILGLNVDVDGANISVSLIARIGYGECGTGEIDIILVVVEDAFIVLPDVLVETVGNGFTGGVLITHRDHCESISFRVATVERQLARGAR